MSSRPRKTVAAIVAGCVAVGATAVIASQEHVVTQKNRNFSLKKLAVKVGDTVRFTNEDGFAHNVFSLSDTKSFDLGSFGQGVSRSVVFDKPGAVEVECAVHPDMRMVVEVAK
jgi:plastocyanin